MQNDKESYVGHWLRKFLCEYLVTVRNMSENTRKSYRDTYRMLLTTVASDVGKEVDALQVADMTAERITGFLDAIETRRKCTVRTRNQRLAAIASLARYIAIKSPEHVEWCSTVRNIPVKRHAKRMIHYFEKDEMDAILSSPDVKSEQGFRDHALLLFLYNTGARASEAASVRVRDVTIPRGHGETPMVTLFGKGRKVRACPLWKTTCDELKHLIRGRNELDNLFISRSGSPITRFGIYEMVERHANAASEKIPSIRSKRPSPHTIRHTTATHLLQSGVDINTVRAWLGHVSLNTTNVYAEVSMEMKSAALQECEVPKAQHGKCHWREDRNLMDFLDGL